MTADSELKNLELWYQMLEAEAVSAEAWTTILINERWVQVLKRIHRVREREGGTNKFGIIQMATTTITTTLTKGYKVTLYSDWLRATTLHAIYKDSLNLDCPKGQCEYGHYTPVFDTSP